MYIEESIRRKEDTHIKYLKESICDKDKGKPFVFLSYKSEDWEAALHGIAYSLAKDYGLEGSLPQRSEGTRTKGNMSLKRLCSARKGSKRQ